MNGPAHPIRFAIQYAFYNDRYRDQSWWRRAWARFWGFVFDRLWHSWIRPHLIPRTYAREHARFWGQHCVPPLVEATVTREDDDIETYYIARATNWGEPFYGLGDTEHQAVEHFEDMVEWIAREAGTVDRSYRIEWSKDDE